MGIKLEYHPHSQLCLEGGASPLCTNTNITVKSKINQLLDFSKQTEKIYDSFFKKNVFPQNAWHNVDAAPITFWVKYKHFMRVREKNTAK